VEGKVLKHLTRLGYRPAQLSKAHSRGSIAPSPPRFQRLADDRPCRHGTSRYALCEAIENRRAVFPTDNYKPLDIAQLCANDEDALLRCAASPGAKRFIGNGF
jgi:hypothetical protein